MLRSNFLNGLYKDKKFHATLNGKKMMKNLINCLTYQIIADLTENIEKYRLN